MSDIFNMEDMSDLPDALQKELLLNQGKWFIVIDLFREASRPLNINEIMVALWRKHDITITRIRANSILHNYCKGIKSHLVRTKHKGQFKLRSQL